MELAQGRSVAEVCRSLGGARADLLPLAKGVRRSKDGSGQAVEGPRAGEHSLEEGGCRPDLGQADSAGGHKGKRLSPARRRQWAAHVCKAFGCLGTPGLSSAQPTPVHPAPSMHRCSRRGCPDEGHRHPGRSVWSLWLSSGHGLCCGEPGGGSTIREWSASGGGRG